MSETPESLLKLVNSSGFLFQLRVEQEIKALEAFQLGKLELVAREHRWIDPIDGKEGFIDLILKLGIIRMVFECKRVTEATWVFLIPDNQDKIERARLLWTLLTRSGTKITEWHDFKLTPPSPEATFCIVRGQGDKDTPMLERVSSMLLRSIEALANEEMNRQTQLPQENSIYYPVVITNASLQVCHFSPSSVNIATGRLDTPDFQEVPFVRFRKNLSSTLVNHLPQSDLQTANLENERTVVVINAGHLANMMRKFGIPYESNAPWPWARLNS